jgi:hypothetical protein
MGEIWLPSETISVTTTLYANGERSAQTINGQFHKRTIGERETGFAAPPVADAVKALVHDGIGPPPRA